eukprot:Opistho-2@92974
MARRLLSVTPIVVLLVALLSLHEVKADGTITAYFFSVKNAGGLQKNGNCCDNLCYFGVWPCICNPFEQCDTAVNFCLNYDREQGKCKSDSNSSGDTLGANEFTLTDPVSFSRSFTGSLKNLPFDVRVELVDNDFLTTASITDAVRSISSLKNTYGSVTKFTEEASWITFVWGYSVKCAKNYYGDDCGTYCDTAKCGANGSCKINSGLCDCKGNFTGDTCNTCKELYYGTKCDACKCQSGICNDGINGNGTCKLCSSNKFYGPLCIPCNCTNGTCSSGITGNGTCISCNANYFGPTCNSECQCKNGTCDGGISAKANGTCVGACKPGAYGELCDKACTCQNGVCNRTTGKCDSCVKNFYGPLCDQQCAKNRACACKDGIAGDGTCNLCTTPKQNFDASIACNDCLPIYYGVNCTKNCSCVNGVSNSGINGTGNCTSCNPKYFGQNCDQNAACQNGTPRMTDGVCTECMDGYFGPTCNDACTCKNGGTCKQNITGDGKCLLGTCQNNYFGDNCDKNCGCVKGVCNQSSSAGVCRSDEGYNCEQGYFGANCTDCLCVHGTCNDGISGDGMCNAMIGCQPGFSGPLCNISCTCISANGVCDTSTSGNGTCKECNNNLWGLNCDKSCACVNGVCDGGPNGNGTCKGPCNEAKYGAPNCDICAPGYFGYRCTKCLCETTQGICNDTKSGDGLCIGCNPGFSGRVCDVSTGASAGSSSSSGPNVGVIAGAVVGGGLVVVGVALFLTYRHAQKVGDEKGAERTWQLFSSKPSSLLRETRESPTVFLNPMHPSAAQAPDIELGVRTTNDGIQYANLSLARTAAAPGKTAEPATEYDLVRHNDGTDSGAHLYDEIKKKQEKPEYDVVRR